MEPVAGLVQRFVAEAHSLAKLDHPNIVKVHQIFKENNPAYMALDYAEGHDLLDTVRRPDLALTPSGVRSTLLKLLDAIGAVHAMGLLHRDISPDNILIDSKRGPILFDFGVARDHAPWGEGPASTLHMVKDGYSPQELHLSGGDQGPWSDLYALAATSYHVITGEAPPNGQERLAAMAGNTSDPCDPLAARSDESALTADWTVELPFAAAESDPARVLRTTGAPDWFVPGLQITAENGTPVARIDETPGVLRQSLSPGQEVSVAVLPTTLPKGAFAPVEQTIDLPVVHRVALSSGARFLVRWQGESWQDEILALPTGYTGEMREGDLGVGHVSTGIRLNKPCALADALLADIIAGSGSSRLAVQQAGQMWMVTFPLPK